MPGHALTLPVLEQSMCSRVTCCSINLLVLHLHKADSIPSPAAHACREHHHPATARLAHFVPGLSVCCLLPDTLLLLQLVDLGHAVEASQATTDMETYDIDDLAYLAPETVGSQHQLSQASRCTTERPVALLKMRLWRVDMAASKTDFPH